MKTAADMASEIIAMHADYAARHGIDALARSCGATPERPAIVPPAMYDELKRRYGHMTCIIASETLPPLRGRHG